MFRDNLTLTDERSVFIVLADHRYSVITHLNPLTVGFSLAITLLFQHLAHFGKLIMNPFRLAAQVLPLAYNAAIIGSLQVIAIRLIFVVAGHYPVAVSIAITIIRWAMLLAIFIVNHINRFAVFVKALVKAVALAVLIVHLLGDAGVVRRKP